MYLSYQDIEEIAMAALLDFQKVTGIASFSTPIDQFAREYLGLRVRYARLSSDGSILGLTAYADTVMKAEERGLFLDLPLKANDVVLDMSFIESPIEISRQCGKRRFTLAHECAHQILFEMESEGLKAEHREAYSARRSYSLRDLKTREDWNEWQANALGAAILMPAEKVLSLTQKLNTDRRIISYDGRFNQPDSLVMSYLTHLFGVSRSAMSIRLEQLDLLVRRPRNEFYDPTEVFS